MKSKFEIGDRAIYKPDNYVGTINGIDRDTDVYSILYDDGEERYVHENDLEFVNPKAVFLTRLQELLATFDASIEAAGEGTDSATIDIYINDKQLIYSEDWNDNEFICKITAENIVNYDKD